MASGKRILKGTLGAAGGATAGGLMGVVMGAMEGALSWGIGLGLLLGVIHALSGGGFAALLGTWIFTIFFCAALGAALGGLSYFLIGGLAGSTWGSEDQKKR